MGGLLAQDGLRPAILTALLIADRCCDDTDNYGKIERIDLIVALRKKPVRHLQWLFWVFKSWLPLLGRGLKPDCDLCFRDRNRLATTNSKIGKGVNAALILENQVGDYFFNQILPINSTCESCYGCQKRLNYILLSDLTTAISVPILAEFLDYSINFGFCSNPHW